jgi:hypothetical protein
MVKEFGENVRMKLRAINILELTNLTKNMVMENLLGNLEIYTREIIIRMREMVMEKCILQMEQYIKEIGQEVCKLEKQQ